MRVLRSKKTWLCLSVVAVVAAAAWCAWVWFGPDPAAEWESVEAVVPAAVPSPTAQPLPPRSPVEPALPRRIAIPSIGVDAPVSVKSLTADGTMQAPDGPEDVAWYDFTARPGAGGNAVFSAHLDYHDYGPAVFAGLKDLSPGDIVEVFAVDGAAYRYEVSLAITYGASEAPVDDIVGPTVRETVTLITCAGTFDASSRQYSHRLVVRAERIQTLATREVRP